MFETAFVFYGMYDMSLLVAIVCGRLRIVVFSTYVEAVLGSLYEAIGP